MHPYPTDWTPGTSGCIWTINFPVSLSEGERGGLRSRSGSKSSRMPLTVSSSEGDAAMQQNLISSTGRRKAPIYDYIAARECTQGSSSTAGW